MTRHILKTIDHYYDAVEDGRKTFEIRANDRGFQTGDELELVRINSDFHPTGERLVREISYMLTGGQFGLEPSYVILALRVPL